jgi:hypothetical protein
LAATTHPGTTRVAYCTDSSTDVARCSSNSSSTRREEKKILAQKLVEETARKHQTELQSANSSAVMARLVGTLTQMLELPPTL